MTQQPRHRREINQQIQYQDEMNSDYRAIYDARQLGQLPELSWKQMGIRGGLAAATLALTVALIGANNQSVGQIEQPSVPSADTYSSGH